MQDNKDYTLSKGERLCRKKLIDHLFLDRAYSKKEWPIRVVYQVVKRKSIKESQVEILVSVSKRFFKRAVKRNLVKRQIREAYRKNKELVTQSMEETPEAKLLIAFLWQSDKVRPTEDIEKMMTSLLQKVGEHVHLVTKENEQWKEFAY